MRINQLSIRTPEGIVFPLLLAGPASRFFAVLIDLAALGALTAVLGSILALARVLSADFAQAIAVLFFFVVQIGYAICCEWFFRGQTAGKRLLRLRVMDAQGLKLQFSQVVIRNLLRFVDILPFFYLVGGVACLISSRNQRLGDLAANTVVVRIPSLRLPDVEQMMSGKYNSMREYPHLEARLRQNVKPEEAALALHALIRREEFEPAARVELFGDLAGHFRGLVTFPPEAVETLTDEQYVRNVVDALFRKQAQRREAAAAKSAV